MIKLVRRHVVEETDRHGNLRYYFRVRHGRRIRMPGEPGTEEFDKRYHELTRQHAAGELKALPRDAPTPGTFRWLCVEHFKSVSFKDLDPRTQRVTRLIVDRMLQEPIAPGAKVAFGECPLSRFDGKAVRILRDRRADRPEAANNRVRRLRRIFAWGLDAGIESVTSNPARDVPLLKPRRAGGFPVWTMADIEKFEEHHAIGTKARLAHALLSYTGVRRSDVVHLGKQHVRNGMLVFRQFKGRNRSPLTLELPILPDLQRVIDATETGDLAFLVTEHGQPFSAAGFGNWFREQCDAAGLKGLSAHGMRKAAATRAAERGATAHQLMAIFGWRTIKQAEVYTRAAERKRLASAAMHLLGTDDDQKSLTSDQQTSPVREKRGKK